MKENFEDSLRAAFTAPSNCQSDIRPIDEKYIMDLQEAHGEPKKYEAIRFNDGKPQYSMIDLRSLEQCARVLEFGAKKYERSNWKKGMPLSKIIDSLLRHISALQDGEKIDPESGLSHIGHIQCNALFLGNIKNTDDL